MRLQHRIALVLSTVVVAAGIVAAGPAVTASAAAPSTGRYTPIDTTRVWTGTVRTTPTVVPITGRAGIPTNATAVVVNVEVEKPTATGYVRVTPAGVDSTVATQEFSAGQTISNLTTVKIGAKGSLQVKVSSGTATGYFDVSGYYSDTAAGATYTPLDTTTRVFSGTVGTTPVIAPIAGVGGVPSDATAVAVNTEVDAPTAAGYVRVTPSGSDPKVAAQEFRAGQSVANLVIVKLSGGAAQVKLSAGSAAVHLDVSGYYANSASGSVFVPLDTTRAFSGPVSTTTQGIRLTGIAGVPGTATAVVANAEIGAPTTAGYLRVTPAGRDADVATQVYSAGHDVSNLVMTRVTGSTVDRRVQARTSAGSGTLFLDVAGYFVDGTSGSGFGADISWPQGGSASGYPTNQAFAIVGVNHGLATTTNEFLAQQLAWAKQSPGGTSQPTVQLYVNTANPGQAFKDDPKLSRASWPTSNVDPGGTTVPASASGNPYGTCVSGTAALTSTSCSWMYGWNRAYEDAQKRGVTAPGSYRWWLDAETDGSWQETTALNRATLEGMTSYFTSIGASAGVYSSPSEWTTLFGTVPSTSPLYTLPTWRAIGSATPAQAQAACTAAPYVAGGATTLVQYVQGGFDRDVTCV